MPEERHQTLVDILHQFESDIDGLDVGKSWEIVNAQLKLVASIRVGNDSEDGVLKKADKILDNLLPLFFKYWAKTGKLSEDAFKTFVTCQKFDHQLTTLRDNGLFTKVTLQPIEMKLKELQNAFGRLKITAETKDKSEMEFYKQAMSVFESKIVYLLKCFHEELDGISSALLPIHDRLVQIKTELDSLIARKNPHAFSLMEVQVLQDEVGEIDSARIDGKYMTKDDSVVAGQAAVIDLLESCYDDIHELLASRDPLSTDNPLRPMYEELIAIKSRLDNFALLSRWTLKSEELVAMQVQLGAIDSRRVDGKFMADDGSIPEGQAVLHFLIHKCYRLIYKLNSDLEPVAETLMPIYNQLLTLEKCLKQLKKWNVGLSGQELIPYQMKLQVFADLQKDGKYYDNEGNIPEGQAVLFGLIETCHDLLKDLHESEDDGINEDDDDISEDDDINEDKDSQ